MPKALQLLGYASDGTKCFVMFVTLLRQEIIHEWFRLFLFDDDASPDAAHFATVGPSPPGTRHTSLFVDDDGLYCNMRGELELPHLQYTCVG